MAAKTPKRPKKATKAQIIRLRATVDQKRMFGEAAARAGACLKAARAGPGAGRTHPT